MCSLRLVALILLVSLLCPAYSLHLLAETRDLPDSAESLPGSSESVSADIIPKAAVISNNTSGSVPSVKGNIGSITSILTNPTQIINQIQNTVNTFLTTLNNTLSGSSRNITSLLGSLKNITNKPRGTFRLEDADFVLANLTEIVKSSQVPLSDEGSDLSSSATHSQGQVHGAFEDFRQAILHLRNLVHDKNPLPQDEDEPEAEVKKANNTTLVQDKSSEPNEGHGVIGESTRNTEKLDRFRRDAGQPIDLTLVRQYLQQQQNQTQSSAIMAEVQRLITELAAPVRSFFETLRSGMPTAVVTAKY